MTTLDVEIKRRLKTYTKHQEESLGVAPHAYSTDPKNETSRNYVRSCRFHQLRRTTKHYDRSSERNKHWLQLARAINGAKQSKISQEHFSTSGTQAENCTKATRNSGPFSRRNFSNACNASSCLQCHLQRAMCE